LLVLSVRNIKLLPVGAKLYHTDRHDKANSHFLEFCECTHSGSDTQRLEQEVHVVGKIKEQHY